MSENVSADGPDLDDARFAANFAAVREREQISQAELVRRLRDNGWVGVHQTTISRIEKGERPVRLGEARAIARALNTDLTKLLLTPGASRTAGTLAYARDKVGESLMAIARAAEDWAIAREQLQSVCKSVADEGYEPTADPHLGDPKDWTTGSFISSGTVEDELRSAIEMSEREATAAVDLGVALSRMREDES